jgi:hypothetical protein
VANAIVEALEHAAQRVGRTLSDDAARAVERMYRDAGVGLRRVIQNIERAEERHAAKMVELAERIGKYDSRPRLSASAARKMEASENYLTRMTDPTHARDWDYDVTVHRSQYPESAAHIEQAQSGTIWHGDTETTGRPRPSVLTIDRDGADLNRENSLRGIDTRSGVDRDEYPPAMFREGGSGASVKYVPSGDNQGAGASIGNQTRGLPEGTRVRITVR